MAFNFNWSPLIADTSRARDMLTTALNKSPKPPIIVDDIVVNELNLGSIPPELEILEIGDLAEDRFRGIFKMSYTGDAYLTLKTRVQANPLNTYLSTKPSFASPGPLAAASGLTIPIQITLSDIRLSGFVILVFSRQKGITLVFRNDPLESLKVSSTFDSIPFVRNYLQKEIEAQLRVLFMDDLPAIIHRLSLRHFVPEYRRVEDEKEEEEEVEVEVEVEGESNGEQKKNFIRIKKKRTEDDRPPVDPLSSPPQNPTDIWAEGLDDSPNFSLESPTETHASFSQKNLLRLAALSDSQRTLSLFTPSIRDTVFRAWAGAKEGGESSGITTPRPFSLSRIHSSIGTSASYSSSASEASDASTYLSRPSLSSHTSGSTVYTMGAHRTRSHAGRKRKHRIVDLRKPTVAATAETDSVAPACTESNSAPSITVTEPVSSPLSNELDHTPEPQHASPTVPLHRVRFHSLHGDATQPPSPERTRVQTPAGAEKSSMDTTPTASSRQTPGKVDSPTKAAAPQRPKLASSRTAPSQKESELSRSSSSVRFQSFSEGSTGGILEQAWMMKMAQEIAKKVHEEKGTAGFWNHAEVMDQPPPAYGV
ncbi:hypothetical protein AAFC00_001690 [Neodothiora populina]|uniref:Mitochondrial distribution and morphology protein 34 n=1 Tax=Neodothiora populina TaxID=2781224 RepID=A0ABR3PQ39_9PEZI